MTSLDATNRAIDEAARRFAAGDITGAHVAAERIVAAAPTHVGALGLLASMKRHSGDLVGALDLLERAQSLAPTAATVALGRARVLLELARTEEAANALAACARLAPTHAPARLLLAQTLERLGRFAEALDSYEEGLRLDRRQVAAIVGKGTCLANLNRHAEALGMFDAALRLAPNEPAIHFNRAQSLMALGRHSEAISATDTCLRLQPHDNGAKIQRGVALLELNRLEDALAAFEGALAEHPTAEAAANLGLTLLALSRGEEALSAFDRAVELGRGLWPQRRASLQYHRGLALYLHDFQRGWPDYEMRWAAGLVDPPALDRGEPAWRGQNLDGTLRIWREQPIGDELLFARLVSSAKGRARRVIFECSQRFVPLFARSFPDIEVRQQGDVSERAEAQVSLASLGKVLAADRAALGQGLPYLKADPAATAALRSRYQELAQGRLIVGISWFSNNKRIGKHKSTEPTEWGGLLSLGHFFVNLQYGKAASEAIAANERFGCGIHTDPTVDQLASLEMFAAQVAALDAVVSVSNTTVHFAGALGVPCVVMLPPGRGVLWYWGLSSEATPWYASVRISRAKKGWTWAQHVAHAADELGRKATSCVAGSS